MFKMDAKMHTNTGQNGETELQQEEFKKLNLQLTEEDFLVQDPTFTDWANNVKKRAEKQVNITEKDFVMHKNNVTFQLKNQRTVDFAK